MNWFKNIYILLPPLIYLPALLNFFSGDDWFHLRITQISSLGEFLNFFSFFHTTQSATFYRPLSTQTFFFVFQKLFSLTAWPYYLFVLICFGYSLYLVYCFALSRFKDKDKSLLTAFIYGISVSNFTRLYFLSAFQEIVLVIFSLLCLLSFEKSKLKSLIFFVLALLSKETAIVLPILLLIFNFKDIGKRITGCIPFIVLSLIYLLLRFNLFGIAQGDSYVWNFSLVKAGNTLIWYMLWSIGSPEFLVDYIGSGFRPISRFFTDFSLWWPAILGLLLGTSTTLAVLFIGKRKKLDFNFFKYLLLFLLPLAPVIFLPQHKFSLELGLPLVGFSLLVVNLLLERKTVLSIIFFSFYIALNLSMNYLTYSRHYAVSRGNISRSVYKYISKNYPILPQKQYFEFINDVGDYGKEWGQSKQISQALSSSDFFKVYYKNKDVKVYYQDMVEGRPINREPIILSSKQFLSQ